MTINLYRFLEERIDGPKLHNLHIRCTRERKQVEKELKKFHQFSDDRVQQFCDAIENIQFFCDRKIKAN